MDPAGTVDSFSSSSSSSPTPNPLSSAHSSIPPSSVGSAGMAGQEVNLAVLASQFQQLLAATAQMQQQLSSLMPRVDSDVHPVEPTHRVGGPVDAPIQAVQSEPALAPAAPALSSFPPLSSHVVNLKVATPDPFTGDDLAKSEEFINSLHLYFFGKQGLTDEQKVTFALSYMKGGRAGRWSKNKIKEYSKLKKAPSFDEFLDEFREMFSDPDPMETARHKLSHLKQGNKSAEDYVADFKEVMDETGFNDAALAHMFERGLSKQLVRNITLSLPAAQAPQSLKQWMTLAVESDRFYRRMEGKHGFIASSNSTTSNQPKPPPHQPPRQTVPPVKPSPSASSSSADVVPMEVDTTRKRVGPRVCFKCRKPGHIARDCQSKFDINALDYEGLKAHIRKEMEEEAKRTKEEKETKEKQDF